jgi:hypothetical protein
LTDLFDAGFLTHGFFGHLSYVLMIVSMMMRRMLWLRLLVIVSAVSGIIYDWVMIGNVVGAFWQVLLIAVNVVQIILLWTRDRRARFTEEEARMAEACLRAGSPGNRRRLLDQGRWESVPEGTRLTEEGERPGFLTYLSEGTARIDTGNTEVARMEPGHFVGEMSLMGDGLASADVTVAEPARVWRIDRDRLERMRTQQPELFALIEAGIALDLRAKVIATNTRAAAAPA